MAWFVYENRTIAIYMQCTPTLSHQTRSSLKDFLRETCSFRHQVPVSRLLPMVYSQFGITRLGDTLSIHVWKLKVGLGESGSQSLIRLPELEIRQDGSQEPTVPG